MSPHPHLLLSFYHLNAPRALDNISLITRFLVFSRVEHNLRHWPKPLAPMMTQPFVVLHRPLRDVPLTCPRPASAVVFGQQCLDRTEPRSVLVPIPAVAVWRTLVRVDADDDQWTTDILLAL